MSIVLLYTCELCVFMAHHRCILVSSCLLGVAGKIMDHVVFKANIIGIGCGNASGCADVACANVPFC